MGVIEQRGSVGESAGVCTLTNTATLLHDSSVRHDSHTLSENSSYLVSLSGRFPSHAQHPRGSLNLAKASRCGGPP